VLSIFVVTHSRPTVRSCGSAGAELPLDDPPCEVDIPDELEPDEELAELALLDVV
jgi:hypothetical protein